MEGAFLPLSSRSTGQLMDLINEALSILAYRAEVNTVIVSDAGKRKLPVLGGRAARPAAAAAPKQQQQQQRQPQSEPELLKYKVQIHIPAMNVDRPFYETRESIIETMKQHRSDQVRVNREDGTASVVFIARGATKNDEDECFWHATEAKTLLEARWKGTRIVTPGDSEEEAVTVVFAARRTTTKR